MIKPSTRPAPVRRPASTLALPAFAAERAGCPHPRPPASHTTLVEGPHGVLIHVVAKGLPPGPRRSTSTRWAPSVASKGRLNPAAAAG